MPKHHPSATQLSAVAVFILGLVSVTIDGHAQEASTPKSEEAERDIRLYLAGERDQAEEALRVAVKRRQDDADAWFYLGLTLHYRGSSTVQRRYAEEIQAFKTAAALRPESGAWYGIGRDLTRMDRIWEALQAYELALEVDHGFVPAISARASLFLLSDGLAGAASTATKRALELDPGNAEAHWVIGTARLRERINSGDRLLNSRTYGPGLSYEITN
jgi:tetratricopeptide (TPR) repeat protein